MVYSRVVDVKGTGRMEEEEEPGLCSVFFFF
jgi:hypothetical protein